MAFRQQIHQPNSDFAFPTSVSPIMGVEIKLISQLKLTLERAVGVTRPLIAAYRAAQHDSELAESNVSGTLTGHIQPRVFIYLCTAVVKHSIGCLPVIGGVKDLW
jgi:hypothetical protein